MANFNSNSDGPNMQSGIDWFWRNYNKCVEWQERHKYSYWKSKAVALEYERDALVNYIQSTCAHNGVEVNKNTEDMQRYTRKNVYDYAKPGLNSSSEYISQHGHIPRKYRRGKRHRRRSRMSGRKLSTPSNQFDDDATYDEVIDVNPECEEEDDSKIDKDFLEFFKQSMKHKKELKKRKASEESDTTTDSSTCKLKSHSDQRFEEMRALYGDKAPMILGMETAMQLTFERNCEKLNPVLWPVLPIKL